MQEERKRQRRAMTLVEGAIFYAIRTGDIYAVWDLRSEVAEYPHLVWRIDCFVNAYAMRPTRERRIYYDSYY